jgi:insulysin
LNAVNNEHEKNLQSDYWRMAQLSESALNPDHPIARFSTGNFVTLRDEPKAKGIDIRERSQPSACRAILVHGWFATRSFCG